MVAQYRESLDIKTMITMIKKQEILIGYYRLGKSKHQLARELQISRNTVKRYIAEHEKLQALQKKTPDELEAGITGPPQYNSNQRTSKVLNEAAKELIKGYLEANEQKRQTGLVKQQMAGTDIWEALKDAGHELSYSTVIRYIRKVKKQSAEVFIKQQYAPGQAVEFDWGVAKLKINGTIKILRLAVFTSSYSNHRWAKLFYREDMPSFLQSHVNYFSEIGHVPQQMVYDNMRVAVKKFAQRNTDKLPTDDLLSLSIYYHFNYRFCNTRKGNEKGHVERSVEFIRRKAFSKNHSFESLEQANQQLKKTCQKLNQGSVKDQACSIEQKFQEEINVMIPAPATPYDVGELRALRVDKFSCIRVDTNQYSIPEGYVGNMLEVKLYPNRIIVYNADNQIIATHERRRTRFEFYLVLDHFLNTLKKKPGALLGSVSFHQASQELRDIFKNHFQNNPKIFIELLIFIKDEQYSIEQLREGIERSMQLRPNHPICLDSLKLLLAQKNKPSSDLPLTDTISKQIDAQCALQLTNIQNQFSSTQNQ